MNEQLLPDLSFPMVNLGAKETPWDLLPLLYIGGSSARVDGVKGLIETGALGVPVKERIVLVMRIHEEISASLVSGGSKYSARKRIESIRKFFGWADKSKKTISLDTVEIDYLLWTDYEINRSKIKKELTEASAYNYGKLVGWVLDRVLEREKGILSSTRLTIPVQSARVRGVQADKQNLTETFQFGHMLLDISAALTVEALWRTLPLHIQLSSGNELVLWSGLKAPDRRASGKTTNTGKYVDTTRTLKRREAYLNDKTFRTRAPLINLRIEAEMLIFIGQTGMNRAQAHQLKRRHYSYKSIINGYEVRDYKHRRGGEVMFEIFSEYRELFERYLVWRREVFPDDPNGLLFPLIRETRAGDQAPRFYQILKVCKTLKVPFISASRLRNTRINWLLRRSRDPDLTAEVAQHSKETLHAIYEEPSLQVAMTEVSRFWSTTDTALPSPGPGVCNGVAVPIVGLGSKVPKPDCIRPAGCLWCDHHRDIDSLDYVWSMACMRHLKTLAINGFRPRSDFGDSDPAHYVQLTLERLTNKLHWFKQSNELRQSWVTEALARVDEGDYHPSWGYIIESIEGK